MLLTNDLLETPSCAADATRRWPRPLLLGGPFVLVAAVALALVASGLLDRGEDAAATAPVAPAIQRAADGSVLIPSHARDGLLAIQIPPGTAETMAAGGNGYTLPPVIDLTIGDKIVITNNDVYPHLMLFAFVMPGQTVERTFTKPSTETYSAGCTIDPTPNGFTSLFVHKAEG